MNLKKSNKGFTMVELLLVLAIIAILAAVAIPIYSSQLENSRIKIDETNLRAATGLAVQDYLVRYAGETIVDKVTGNAMTYTVYALIDNKTSTITSQSKCKSKEESKESSANTGKEIRKRTF